MMMALDPMTEMTDGAQTLWIGFLSLEKLPRARACPFDRTGGGGDSTVPRLSMIETCFAVSTTVFAFDWGAW